MVPDRTRRRDRAPGRPHNPVGYTLGQLSGTVTVVAPPDAGTLAAYTARVVRTNGWDAAFSRSSTLYPPIRHVVYIIKENRTYDQLFGDLSQADGDTAIVFFGRAVTPNHHALAERFGIWDRFFCNAEVSGRRAQLVDGGVCDRLRREDGPVAVFGAAAVVRLRGDESRCPAAGRRRCERAGNGVCVGPGGPEGDLAAGLWRVRGTSWGRTPRPGCGTVRPRGTRRRWPRIRIPISRRSICTIPDQKRADIWIAELAQYEQTDSMPAFEIVHLPNDHTAGAKPKAPTPRAYVADNDLAFGRMIEALSRSRFWASTVVFVLEDDAQNGRRSCRFASVADARHLAVDEGWCGASLRQHDRRAGDDRGDPGARDVVAVRPLSGVRCAMRSGRQPDTAVYVAVHPSIPMTETNPDTGRLARLSRGMDFRKEDQVDDALLNHVLWRAVKGPIAPEPAPRRASTLDFVSGR